MRISALVSLIVVAPACWADNPVFGLATETSATTGSAGSIGSSATSAMTGSSATSGSSTDVTTVTSSSAGPGTNGSSSEPVSGSGEPTSSSGEPGSTTSTGEPGSTGVVTTLPVDTTGDVPVVCADPPVNDSLNVEVAKNGVAYTGCMQAKEAYKGVLYMDGTMMKLKLSVACMAADPAPTLVLMSGFSIPVVADPVCADVLIDWDPEGVDCKLGLLQVRDFGTKKLLYVGAFRLDPYESFPLHAEGVNVTECGCPPDMKECCDPKPGTLELIPMEGDPVAQYEVGYAKEDGVIFDFYNFQSWIDPSCMMGGNNGRHIDWLAVVTDGG